MQKTFIYIHPHSYFIRSVILSQKWAVLIVLIAIYFLLYRYISWHGHWLIRNTTYARKEGVASYTQDFE